MENMLRLNAVQGFQDEFLKSFDQMPDYKYLKSDFPFRKRSYGTGSIIDGVYEWNKQETLFN